MLRNLFKSRHFSTDFPKSKPQSPPTSSIQKNKTNSHCSSSGFLVFCNSQITKLGRNGDLAAAHSLFNRMHFRDVVSWTSLLSAYAHHGHISTARQLFDQMPHRNLASWNAMLSAYALSGDIPQASSLFSQMPLRNPVSYSAMISAFARAGMLTQAENLYSEMPPTARDPVASNALISGYLKAGQLERAVWVFEGMRERDVVSWSSIVDGYCKQGRLGNARDVFDRMPERNVVSWTAMISGYFRAGMWEDGFRSFSVMRSEGVGFNSTTLTVMTDASACSGRLGEGIQIHGLVLKAGFDHDVFLGNSLITMFCKSCSIELARKVFDLLGGKDIVSWNSLLTGYVHNGRIEEAYELFQGMPERDPISWTTMVAGLLDGARIGEALRLFEDMPFKDCISWTAIISGFVGNGEYEQAFHWFVQMGREGVMPITHTLSSLLSASAGLAALNQGLQIHALVFKLDSVHDISVQNSLISMYAKCGNVDNAHQIFSSINEPNLVSFNSMITGFAQHGLGEEALGLFNKMQVTGCEPNSITFLGVLSACAHAGLVEEAWSYFKSMSSVYCIEPVHDHYTCMVDLLGRTGLLKEAMDLIHSMPFKPRSALWGALLSGCMTHSNLELAKLAAHHLFELKPESGTAYAVLSKMYSLSGLKSKEEELRILKKSRGVKKSPGCSWIIVHNKVHLFLAGDQSHVESNEIWGVLRSIAMIMDCFVCEQMPSSEADVILLY